MVGLTEPMREPTTRFLYALSFAVELHCEDSRKGSGIPYTAHLLSVCSLVIGDGGSEDEAIAALLHDAIEDHPEEVNPGLILRRFGRAVHDIVVACTDTPVDYRGGEKPPWRVRKTQYLEHLKELRPDQCRVPLADKLDNIRTTIKDLRDPSVGERVWNRFRAGKSDQLWLYESLAKAFREAGATGYLLEEFDRNVEELTRLSGLTPRQGL